MVLRILKSESHTFFPPVSPSLISRDKMHNTNKWGRETRPCSLDKTLKQKSLLSNFTTVGPVLCHRQCTQAKSGWPLWGQVQDPICASRNTQGRDRDGWKQATAWSCKRNPSLPSQLALQNRYKALGMRDERHDEIEEEEPVQALLPRSDQLTPLNKTCIKTSAKKKKQQVMVIGDSILCKMEAPICRPDPLFRVVWCLPVALISDVTRQLSDYYPL